MEKPEGIKEPEDGAMARQPSLAEGEDLERMVEVVGSFIEEDVAEAGADEKAEKTVRCQMLDVVVDHLFAAAVSKPSGSASDQAPADDDGAIEAEGKPQRIPIDAKIKTRDGKGLSRWVPEHF